LVRDSRSLRKQNHSQGTSSDHRSGNPLRPRWVRYTRDTFAPPCTVGRRRMDRNWRARRTQTAMSCCRRQRSMRWTWGRRRCTRATRSRKLPPRPQAQSELDRTHPCRVRRWRATIVSSDGVLWNASTPRPMDRQGGQGEPSRAVWWVPSERAREAMRRLGRGATSETVDSARCPRCRTPTAPKRTLRRRTQSMAHQLSSR
jgi:hypothetical protein